MFILDLGDPFQVFLLPARKRVAGLSFITDDGHDNSDSFLCGSLFEPRRSERHPPGPHVWQTNRSSFTQPMVCQRSSPFTKRSCSLRWFGSSNTSAATSKSTPCLRRFWRFLASSHSKRTCTYNSIDTGAVGHRRTCPLNVPGRSPIRLLCPTPPHAAPARPGGAGGQQPLHHPDHRRNRHRQGADCQSHPHQFASRGAPVRAREPSLPFLLP